ncbi:hypothetical protein C8R43DRAFT_1244422 [Mycena crocata]|nr:hypothetical protein C8R43DRAFT_1244422 [Mycena crocata]
MRFTRVLPLVASVSAAFPTKVIYDSPGFFLENIAVRPCNKLLLTSVASPTLNTFDPAATNGTLTEVFTFPNSTGATGIIEYQPDVYAVVASKLDLATVRAEAGSVAVWSIDLSGRTPRIAKVGQIPESTMINGLATVPGHPDLVLAADSAVGAVYQVSMRTGVARIAIQDVAMAPNQPLNELGINGLHVHDGALYFTNSQQGTFARVPITVSTGKVRSVGAVEVLTRVEEAGQGFDDFTFDEQGRVWVARQPDSLILQYALGNGTWVQSQVAGNLTGPTAAVFGRGNEAQKHTLYVSSVGGQLVSLDTSTINA